MPRTMVLAAPPLAGLKRATLPGAPPRHLDAAMLGGQLRPHLGPPPFLTPHPHCCVFRLYDASSAGSMTPRFSILLPVIRLPIFLPFAIQSVLAQTIREFELLIVCDGAPLATVKCAEDFASRDSRVKVFAFPKGERSGETHRHAALETAGGIYVAHIEDDDLWFPDHLQELEKLLVTVDFGNLIHVWLKEDRNIEALSCNLALPEYRRRFVDEMFNSFGLTVCGYRLDAYRRLPIGWAPSPPGFWPDLWMWRKFLEVPEFRCGTRMVVTALGLPGFRRETMTDEEQSRESRDWFDRVCDPVSRAEIVEAAWRSIVDVEIRLRKEVDGLTASLAQARAAAQPPAVSEAIASVREDIAGLRVQLNGADVTLQALKQSVDSLLPGSRAQQEQKIEVRTKRAGVFARLCMTRRPASKRISSPRPPETS
jgi:hypothetical protein